MVFTAYLKSAMLKKHLIYSHELALFQHSNVISFFISSPIIATFLIL